MAKSTCSCRGLGFGSQCPKGHLQPPVTLVQGNLMHLHDQAHTLCIYIHAGRTLINISKEIIKRANGWS